MNNKTTLWTIIILVVVIIVGLTLVIFRNQIFADVSTGSTYVGTQDNVRQYYSSSSGLTKLSIGATIPGTSGGATGTYITEVKPSSSVSPSVTPSPVQLTFSSISKTSGVLTENRTKGNLTLESKVTPKSDRMQYDLKLSKPANSTDDKPINMCYSVSMDADGGTWYEDIYNTQTIKGNNIYKFVAKKEDEDKALLAGVGGNYDYTNNLSIYPLGLIVLKDKSAGLAFAMPPDMPRSSYIQYDNGKKLYSICYDFVLTPKSSKNFNNFVNVQFSLYKIKDPSYGFRSALERYYSFYPTAFAKGSAETGAFLYSNSFGSSYEPSDYAFKYDWAFGIDKNKSNTLRTDHSVKSTIYSFPDGYVFTKDLSYYTKNSPATCPSGATKYSTYSAFAEAFLTKVLTDTSLTAAKTCTYSRDTSSGLIDFNSGCTESDSPTLLGCASVKSNENKEIKDQEVYFGQKNNMNALGIDPAAAACNALIKGSSAQISTLQGTNVYPWICNLTPCYGKDTPSFNSSTPYTVGINPSPFLPAPSESLTQQSLKTACSGVKNWGNTNIDTSINNIKTYGYDGVSIDMYGSVGRGDFNATHFKNVTIPLVYYNTSTETKTIVYEPFSLYEYMSALKVRLKTEGLTNKVIAANTLSQAGSGFMQSFPDVFMGERNAPDITDPKVTDPLQPQIDRYFARLRALIYRKSYTVMIKKYDSAKAMQLVNQLAFFGNFTYLSSDNSNPSKEYFDDAYKAAKKDELSEYKNTQQAVKTITEAGWQPITSAKSSDAGVLVERYGPSNNTNGTKTMYLVVRNNYGTNGDGGSKSITITPEFSKLGMQNPTAVKELIGKDSSGATISSGVISLTVKSKRTLILELTGSTLVASSVTPTPAPSITVAPPTVTPTPSKTSTIVPSVTTSSSGTPVPPSTASKSMKVDLNVLPLLQHAGETIKIIAKVTDKDRTNATTTYTFWWNCENPSTSVAEVMKDPKCGKTRVMGKFSTQIYRNNGVQFNAISENGSLTNTKEATHVFSAGKRTLKVIAERRGSAVETRKFIDVQPK